MLLDRVEIKNFRSIKNQTFSFNRNFQILVGINESGKSNIIKAISLLDKNRKFDKNDIRDSGYDEDAISSSYIRFIFKIDKELKATIYDDLKDLFLTDDIDSILLDISDAQSSLKDFCNHKDEALYTVDLIESERSMRHWRLSGPQYRIHKHWKEVKGGVLFDINEDGEIIKLSNYKVVNVKDYPNIPDEYLQDLTINTLNSIVGTSVIKITEKYIPSALFWEYSDDNLLPGRVSLSEFIDDPKMCQPLKNMFSLAGYHDSSKSLSEGDEKTNGIRNILRKVSANATTLMQSVWPEWKNQKVMLSQNGDFLEAGIEDEFNVYSLSRRSDGFKRFFTFLLMISAENKSENIVNNVILIDEPDIGLHPSGVQYLREELSKIGENNQVVVSTHSIFMIDKQIIDRHLIVKKENEVTSFSKVDSSNILDEEVVYNALNFSLYEVIKPINIIFEGWRDKETFSMYLRSNKGKTLADKQQISTLGLMHANGVKDISRVANICENTSRKFIIITDSDKPAKEKQKKYDGIGTWYCYNDLKNLKAITTEDFVTNKLINTAINKVFKDKDIILEIILDDTIITDKVKYIEKMLFQNKMDKEKIHTLLNSIKEYICENTKAADLDDSYHNMAEVLFSDLFQNN